MQRLVVAEQLAILRTCGYQCGPAVSGGLPPSRGPHMAVVAGDVSGGDARARRFAAALAPADPDIARAGSGDETRPSETAGHMRLRPGNPVPRQRTRFRGGVLSEGAR